MASVPGPDPHRPFPPPGAPDERELPRESDRREASPAEGDRPAWAPEPYDPERERTGPQEPAGVP